MNYLRRPLPFLAVLFVTILAYFSVIKWHKYRIRQERLCSPSALCQFQDFTNKTKAPPITFDVLRPIICQPLFFLGEGKQCIAYETADGRYVLKLFRKAEKKKKHKQLEEYILGGIIARTVIPEETGMIACVCDSQSFKLPTVTVLNEKGKMDKINLQDVPFLLQRKAQPFKQTLLRLVSEKKIKEAAARLASVFALLTLCRDKGVLDRDGSLIRNENIGFVEEKAILFDTGKLCRCTDRKRQTLHDLNRLKPLQSWLESACPELVSTFTACQDKYQSSIEKRAISTISQK